MVSRAVEPNENHTDAIRQVVSGYEIGHKLRQLRLKKRIALVDLGKQTGLSASMLSQLENGKLIPTLPTLARMAIFFGVGLEFFFEDKRAARVFSVVRGEDRLRFPDTPESPVPGYYFQVLTAGAGDKNLSAYLADFPKTEESPPQREHVHEGSEFIHVLDGTLAIHYGAEEFILKAGDSAYFDSSEAHSYHGKSDTPARAIVVTSPPKL